MAVPNLRVPGIQHTLAGTGLFVCARSSGFGLEVDRAHRAVMGDGVVLRKVVGLVSFALVPVVLKLLLGSAIL